MFLICSLFSGILLIKTLLVKEEINDTIDVINQLSTILTDKTTLAQKRYLSNRDILIRPKIDKLSTTDFSIMEQALELGVQAALLVEPELKKLSVNAQAYLSYQQKKGQKKQQKSLNSLHDKPWFKWQY